MTRRRDLHVSKKSIGHDVFGNCFIGKLAHINVCVKVLKKHRERVFPTEAHILYQCCHENLPWLYGIVSGRMSKNHSDEFTWEL